MRRLAQVLTLSLLASACKNTFPVTVYNLEPSPVVLSKDIRRIGIINEVRENEWDQNIASLEALVRARDLELAKEGTDAALEGLLAELQKDQRFDTVMILHNPVAFWHQGKDQNQEIPWDKLRDLCVNNGLDAVFSLAFYQTDTRISEKKSSMEDVDMLRMKVTIPARELTLETLIENGWRIYDPFEKKVLDEIRVNEQLVTQAKGENALYALRAMTDRSDSLLSRSRGSGSAYGMRLKPFNKAVERDIYIKGSTLLAQAKNAVMEKDWLEAARLWQMDLNHEKSAVRAMACHNMAVLYEIKNDLDKAIEWAVLASTHHESKEHEVYLETLKSSAAQRNLAEKQRESMALLSGEED